VYLTNPDYLGNCADIAGIAGQADDDGAALIGSGEAGHGQEHDESQDHGYELLH